MERNKSTDKKIVEERIEIKANKSTNGKFAQTKKQNRNVSK